MEDISVLVNTHLLHLSRTQVVALNINILPYIDVVQQYRISLRIIISASLHHSLALESWRIRPVWGVFLQALPILRILALLLRPSRGRVRVIRV